MREFSQDDARSALDVGMSYHSQAFGMADVAEVEAYWTDDADEPSFAWLLRLNDGRYVSASGWHDYTGWDCQSGLSCKVYDDREDAIAFGLTLNERELLGLLLPGEAL